MGNGSLLIEKRLKLSEQNRKSDKKAIKAYGKYVISETKQLIPRVKFYKRNQLEDE